VKSDWAPFSRFAEYEDSRLRSSKSLEMTPNSNVNNSQSVIANMAPDDEEVLGLKGTDGPCLGVRTDESRPNGE
jgi:hypothetical protein